MTSRQEFYEQRAPHRVRESGRFYHRLLNRIFTFVVPPGQRVLEVGCGLGDTLAAVKPARGVGIAGPRELPRELLCHPAIDLRWIKPCLPREEARMKIRAAVQASGDSSMRTDQAER